MAGLLSNIIKELAQSGTAVGKRADVPLEGQLLGGEVGSVGRQLPPRDLGAVEGVFTDIPLFRLSLVKAQCWPLVQLLQAVVHC